MNEPESQSVNDIKNDNNNDLDKLLNELDKQSHNQNNTQEQPPQISILPSFIEALKGISEIVAEHTGIQSIRLTETDCNTLKTALKPLEKYIMSLLNYMIYLPLIIFAVGYTLRIVSELRDKKKDTVKKTAKEGFTVERENKTVEDNKKA